MQGSGHPKRALGQNFLVDKGVARRIVEGLPSEGVDTVLEIGPGKGALTHFLRARFPDLVLVELDDMLVQPWLQEAQPGLRVHHGSIMDVRLSDWGEPDRTLVVGNIPYNITTPLVFHLLARPRPRAIVIMMQKEVAERISAPPRTKAYGALSVGVRAVADPHTVLTVSPGAFRPRPRVDSAVVQLTPHRPSHLTAAEERTLRRVVRASFQWRRKQLAKVLRDHPDLRLGARSESLLDGLQIDRRRRPDQVRPDEYIELSRAVARLLPIPPPT